MIMKHCEMMQVYLAIGFLILGYRIDFELLYNISAGLFFGISIGRFIEWRFEINKIKERK